MKLNDAILGAAFLALSIWIAASALAMPRMAGTAIGAGTFPLVVAAMMAMGGLALTLSGVKTWRRAPVAQLSDWLSSRPALTRAGASIVFVVIYAALGEWIGFPLLVPPMMIALLWLTTGRPLASVILGCLISAGVWLLFARVLMVPLPLGLMSRVLY